MDSSRAIVIQPYDDSWPAEFARVEALLRESLDEVAERIDHIGSTAVPGLAAKDVIDVQVAVADLDAPRVAAAFQELGTTRTAITTDHVPPGAEGDGAGWEKRYFRPPSTWRPTHLHVREVGRANFRYALLFRDYLRQAPAATAAYAQVKVALARLHPHDTKAYYDVKDPVSDLVIDAAERWASQTDWSP
jgi:GrpB-like predicted nucleotidyltransferase (UPF0157 family)